jgi:hypothetical protein
MMKHRMTRNLLVLLLGAFLALGSGLSAVQAGEMAVKMTLAADMGSPESGGCSGCAGDDGNAQAGSCHPICTVAAAAVLPSGPIVAIATSDRPVPRFGPVSSGRPSAPDPSPPRGRVLA